ncbi:hypothetical protein BDW67DRAFT_160828 [Aspergillus spinulosporus]
MQGICFTLHMGRYGTGTGYYVILHFMPDFILMRPGTQSSIENKVRLTPLHPITTCCELPEHSWSLSLFWCMKGMPSIVVCSGGHSATLADDQTTTGTRAPLRTSAHDHASAAQSI